MSFRVARRLSARRASNTCKARPRFFCGAAKAVALGCGRNEYVDYVQGLLPNILGYAHDEVNAAAIAQLGQGHSFSLPHPLEVELAERLTRLFPCAEMVRFGKNGSDATPARFAPRVLSPTASVSRAAVITAGTTGLSAPRRETAAFPKARAP
jgi:glutamate-1-semialdehyde aminotransferase